MRTPLRRAHAGLSPRVQDGRVRSFARTLQRCSGRWVVGHRPEFSHPSFPRGEGCVLGFARTVGVATGVKTQGRRGTQPGCPLPLPDTFRNPRPHTSPLTLTVVLSLPNDAPIKGNPFPLSPHHRGRKQPFAVVDAGVRQIQGPGRDMSRRE